MVQNSASCNKLRDACSHVFQGSTLDLELARFTLSAQHEELPQYNAPHTRPMFVSQLYEPRADESSKSYEAQSIIYELRRDSPRKLL